MIQLSLSLGVIGRKKTESLQEVYMKLINSGYTHDQIEEKILTTIQEWFDAEIEAYCNRHMILSNLKVAEDMVTELKQLSNQ